MRRTVALFFKVIPFNTRGFFCWKCEKYHIFSTYLTGMLWGSIGSNVTKFHSFKITCMAGVVSLRIELYAFVNLWWHNVWGSKYYTFLLLTGLIKDGTIYGWEDEYWIKFSSQICYAQCKSTSIRFKNFYSYLQVGL